MKLGGSIPHSQEAATYLHPTSLRFMLILPFHLRLGRQSCLFPLFSHQNPACTPFPYILHALPIPFCLFDHRIILGEEYRAESSSSSLFPCHFITLRAKYIRRHLFSNTLSLCCSLIVTDQVSHPYTTGNKRDQYFCIEFV